MPASCTTQNAPLGAFQPLYALVTDGCFEAPAVTGDAAVFRPAMGLCEQDLLRTLQRLHADLTEHLDDASDDEPVDEALVACIQLGLPPRAGCRSRPLRDQRRPHALAVAVEELVALGWVAGKEAVVVRVLLLQLVER